MKNTIDELVKKLRSFLDRGKATKALVKIGKPAVKPRIFVLQDNNSYFQQTIITFCTGELKNVGMCVWCS